MQAVAAAVGAVLLLTPAASDAAQIATLVGDLQHLIGGCNDWSPPCPASILTPPTEDSFYRGTFELERGYYEHKVAIDQSWNENYGQSGIRDGPNIPLYVPKTANVTFYWDSAAKWMYNSETSPFFYVVGSIQTALGCKTNDNSNCLAGQLTDFGQTGTLTFVAKNVPAGDHIVGIQQTSSIDPDNVSVPPFAIKVPAAGSSVTFSIRAGSLTVAVENGETYTQTVKPIPERQEDSDVPIPTGPPLPNGCVKYSRQHFIKDPVRLGAYQYRGNVLYGELKLKNLGFQKSVTINYEDTTGSWENSCSAVYGSGPYQSNFEVWKFNCPISEKGIKKFYVKYTASGTDYFDSNDGANYNATLLPAWKVTKGFQRDISHFFQRNQPRAARYMLANISPKEASKGVVVAAPRKQSRNQNYFFHWIRDASLTMDVVNELYKRGDKTVEQALWDHAAFTHKIQNIDALTGLGEAKFNVDGTDYTDPWCRPQNDGPAFRASLMIRFSNAYLKNGGDITRVRDLYASAAQGVIKPDLEYVSKNYRDFRTCDLWEEQTGAHFFTIMAIRRSMKEGAVFARFMNDTEAADTYEAAGKDLDGMVEAHWDEAFGTIRTTLNARQLDAAIPLGIVHGYNGDGVFAPNDDKVLATLYTFALGMMTEYRLNLNTYLDNHDGPMGVAIGRYYGDHYDGVLTNGQGNPWYLTTAIYAELYYKATALYIHQGSITVTPRNLPFFTGPRPMGLAQTNLKAGTTFAAGSKEFAAIVDAMIAVADSYMRRVRFYSAPDARFPEEFGRDCGDLYGVDDLTWSYASVLTASFAREEVWGLWKK
ncbi:glycoside hydrolase 15 protein [Dinochytrium kinnereticum]|nr:glycoside hydrolase 15 protein [Dinochytrium kinnereticum]